MTAFTGKGSPLGGPETDGTQIHYKDCVDEGVLLDPMGMMRSAL